MNEPFFFGIPLIARAVAGDWALVEHLFGLTLRSILAQDDVDFRVLLAAHDVPAPWQAVADDPRFTLLPSDWQPEPPTAANDDGGRKKWLVKQCVRQEGGGLLMFLDADDWVPRDLVRRTREAIGPDHVGAVIGSGFALDHASGRMLPFPIGGIFAGAFHQLCGSSTIGRVVPGAPDPLHLAPHATLGSHHQWLAVLDGDGAYLIGTGENHSERDGPFAAWRRRITDAVRRYGHPLDDETARYFGQDDVRPRSGDVRSGAALSA